MGYDQYEISILFYGVCRNLLEKAYSGVFYEELFNNIEESSLSRQTANHSPPRSSCTWISKSMEKYKAEGLLTDK